MPLFRRRSGPAEPEPEPVAPRLGQAEIAERLRVASPTAGKYLADNLLPAVRFAVRRVPEAAIDVGGCKMGCSPDLPTGTAWPHFNASDGRRPLQFFAQIDLAAAAAAAPAPLGLPTEGQLSFFADFDLSGKGVAASQPDASTVLHLPSNVPYTRCSPRIPPLPSAELFPIGVWTWPASVPGHPDLPDRERSALDALARELDADMKREVPELWHGSARHQLGGHAPLPVKVLAGTGSNGADSDQAAGGWRLILQLDSDPSLEVSWADGGTVSWAARRADIAADVWDDGAFTFQPA